MFAEIVYETGRMSVGEYDSEDEVKSAVKAHNDRAIKGEPGGPVGAPAERIAAVYLYDKHPDNFNNAQTASSDVLEKEVSALIKSSADENGVVAIDQLVLGVRGLSHPFVDDSERSHGESFYKMKESKKLNLSFLEGSAA